MNVYFKIFSFLLLFAPYAAQSQTNRIGIGIFFGSGLSLNTNYSYDINDPFFLRPNLSVLITKDGKELFSFLTYEIDLGYYFLNNPHNKIYAALGSSYNSFLSQSREGNASFISDRYPPYYFLGRTREDCYGISCKIGGIGIASSWFSLGLEAKYLLLFPKIKYNYSPEEYSVIKDNETIKMILFGVVIGFSF
ncbi:MAG: hypothetical protein ACYC5R_11425 [Melioribacteraceae bacterium]